MSNAVVTEKDGRLAARSICFNDSAWKSEHRSDAPIQLMPLPVKVFEARAPLVLVYAARPPLLALVELAFHDGEPLWVVESASQAIGGWTGADADCLGPR
jgi:hypothetical protein